MTSATSESRVIQGYLPDSHRHSGTSRRGDRVGQDVVPLTFNRESTGEADDGCFRSGILEV